MANARLDVVVVQDTHRTILVLFIEMAALKTKVLYQAIPSFTTLSIDVQQSASWTSKPGTSI